jgi:hypothetical protein
MPVDTTKVEGRRPLDYHSFDELLADADRLASGPVRTLGNWSPGQIFRHLAAVYNGSIDGFPKTVVPWYLRLLSRIIKSVLLRGSMPPGFRLPPDAAAALVPPETSTEEGLAALHAAVERLQKEERRVRNPMFGDLTRDEWDRIHLKHASLHMSFLVPK